MTHPRQLVLLFIATTALSIKGQGLVNINSPTTIPISSTQPIIVDEDTGLPSLPINTNHSRFVKTNLAVCTNLPTIFTNKINFAFKPFTVRWVLERSTNMVDWQHIGAFDHWHTNFCDTNAPANSYYCIGRFEYTLVTNISANITN